MKNTLRVIVDADCAARREVEQAEARREHLTEELAELRREIDETHRKAAEQAIEKARADAAEQVKRTADEIEQSTKAKIDGLWALYKEKRETWVQEIVSEATAP